MKFKCEFAAVQAVYHELPRSVPYWPFRSCTYILWNFLWNFANFATYIYRNNSRIYYLQAAGRLLKAGYNWWATDSWLHQFQLIVACKPIATLTIYSCFQAGCNYMLVATVGDSWLQLHPAGMMISISWKEFRKTDFLEKWFDLQWMF